MLETRRATGREQVRFRWKPGYSRAALEALVAALPVDGEISTGDRKYRDAARCLRRTANGLAIRRVGHASYPDWTPVPDEDAIAWIDAVGDTRSARGEGCRLSFSVA